MLSTILTIIITLICAGGIGVYLNILIHFEYYKYYFNSKLKNV